MGYPRAEKNGFPRGELVWLSLKAIYESLDFKFGSQLHEEMDEIEIGSVVEALTVDEEFRD